MNGEFSLALAFATGIFGAFHCIGMCSGINGGFFTRYGATSLATSILAFHGTRLGVYTLLGVSGALVGQALVQTGIVGKAQGILMIIAGVLVTLMGLNLSGIGKRREQPRSVKLIDGRTFGNRRRLPLLAGLINGLVPCSLVFSVAVKAAATTDPFRATLLMLAFGVGTLPAMVTVSLLGATIGARARGAAVRLAGIGVVLLGLWTIYEGTSFYNIMRGLANW